jgi:hypothetical protein
LPNVAEEGASRRWLPWQSRLAARKSGKHTMRPRPPCKQPDSLAAFY